MKNELQIEAFSCLHFPFKKLALLTCIILSTACGGSGGSNDDSDNSSIPAGKIGVDGHVFNPDFFTSGRDFYAKLAYFNSDGDLNSYHDIYEWSGDSPTYSNDFRYTYDNLGRLVSEERELTYTREAPAFYSHIFSTVIYTYNLSGLLATETETITAYDNDGDGDFNDVDFDTFTGSVRYIITCGYNGSGQLVSKTHDDDGDGNLMGSSGDKSITYEYDGSGNLTKETILDGIGITTTLINTYDVNNRRNRQSRYPTQARFLADEPASITDYTYDANGKLNLEEIDNGVAFTANLTPDGTPDIVITYSYGSNGDPSEKSTEELHVSFSQIDIVKYTHEVIDDNSDGTPEHTVTYVFWLDTKIDSGGGYPPDLLPRWYQNAQTNLNNGNNSDGWSVNWDGHGSTCSTCGNMLGQINRIIHGF